MSIFSKIFGINKTVLDIYASQLSLVNEVKGDISNLSQEQMRQEIAGFKQNVSSLAKKAENKRDFEINKEIQQFLMSIAPRVFALTREAAKRAIGQFHYDVQVVGGFALAEGKIAEMKTGEGKTLTATLPLVLYSLAGKGAHLVTVNDYLARWQASLMGKVYHYLGISVASIQHEASFLYDPTYAPEAEEIEKLESQTQGLVMDVKHMRPITRRAAYNADITYGTNNEFGFDYLRDNMAPNAQALVQRDLFYVIVDEVDSILIDEARTPLIISMPDTDPTDKYNQFGRLVDTLNDQTDYAVDEKHKSASLTDDGINKIEKALNVPNIYDTSNGVTTIHHIEQALRAKTLFKKDRDYVVRDGEIVIVDEFTGRLMFGRRYSEGLHQAIEAKENVKIQQESKTLATITFQNLFRLYFKLSGMTGTAKTEEEEFFKIYRLTVDQIPTNREMVRQDMHDLVYKTEAGKFAAIAREVKARNEKGQPVLIGTVSIAKNEELAKYLKNEGLKFEILNAKNHEREAQIISQAGRLGQITLATNIAGRGVDILLGGNPVDFEEAELVRKAGGLHVIGSERHESRRIDNQLRGRAGRQGDPGSTQFFESMEDDLMRLFGGDRMKRMMDMLKLPEDQPIEAGMVSKSIESAQKKIEGLNFDTRKHVLEFDDVLNHQRNVIYKRRRAYLPGSEESKIQDLKADILKLLQTEISSLVALAAQEIDEKGLSTFSIESVVKAANTLFPVKKGMESILDEAVKNSADREFVIADELFKAATEELEAREKALGKEMFEGAMRFVALNALDNLWMEHLDTMDHLRDSVRLRGYGQRDPLVEYKREGHEMFQQLSAEINRQIVYGIFRVSIEVKQPEVKTIDPTKLVTNETNSAKQFGSPDSSGQQVGVSSALSSIAAELGKTVEELAKVGRNDPCPCGSGKKFKKCHGKNQ